MTRVHFLVAVTTLLLAALTSSVALADAFSDARAVYDRGDFGSARQMFEPLANSGDRKAQTMMGNIYCYARGVPQDWDKAGEWFRKAADQGEPVAEFAMFFVLRRNVSAIRRRANEQPPDDSEGFAYLLKAAAQDHPGAMWAVSAEYAHPPRKNDVESFSWLRKAADFDVFFLHLQLSHYYSDGIGALANNREAYYWAAVAKRRAEQAGEKFFQTIIESTIAALKAKLQPSDIEDAERRAAAWQPKPIPDFGTDPYIPTEKHRISDQTDPLAPPKQSSPQIGGSQK